MKEKFWLQILATEIGLIIGHVISILTFSDIKSAIELFLIVNIGYWLRVLQSNDLKSEHKD